MMFDTPAGLPTTPSLARSDTTVEARTTATWPSPRRARKRLASRLVAGVAHVRRAPLSPLHDDDAVHVGYLHVLSGFRRRGIGKMLLEAAADWADEKDSKHIVASVAATARDSNRFLARLGLGQVAVVRASTVTSLRCKLSRAATPKTVMTNVIAARRLMRRSRTSAAS